MTREEAIAYGEECLSWNKFSKDMKMYQFIEMAIQALSQEPKYRMAYDYADGKARKFAWIWGNGWTEIEQEPCDDAISRKDVQDYIAKYLSQYLYEDVRQAVEVIDAYIGDMPSVTQKGDVKNV